MRLARTNSSINSQPSKPFRLSNLPPIFLPLFFCAVLFVSCSDKPPIPGKKFVEVYVQLQLLNVQYASQPASHKTKLDSLFKTFGVTDSLISSTMAWYSKDPERWQAFYTEVQKRMSGIKPAYVKEKR